MTDLFGSSPRPIAPGVTLLPGFADPAPLLREIARIAEAAPFRHQMTPGGKPMGAAMTNCGAVGWVSDRRGYRYQATDPESGLPWPPMPPLFCRLATEAARAGGFADFTPDACLVNRYAVGVGMGLHQDKDEADRSAPIVSVSLGLSARFAIRTAGRLHSIALEDGDVVVFGGPAREAEHGIRPVLGNQRPELGEHRFNLTLRKAR